jgi:hypothetical protein
MRLIVVGCMLLWVGMGSVAAQAIASESGGGIYLYKNESDVDESLKRGYYVGPHILGDTITMLMNRFEKDYTYYQESSGAYKTEEKKINKPNIYFKVKKVEKNLTKEVKKGRMDEDEAYRKLKRTLSLAIKLMNYRTDQVEEDLRKLKKTDEILDYMFDLKFRS